MPNHIQESPHIAIELDGYEALIDLRVNDGVLSADQELFIARLKNRGRTLPSPFSTAFDAQRLMERLGSTHEHAPEVSALCQRGLDLLAADAQDLVLASRRVCDAADRVLACDGRCDARSRALALSMRDAARKTQQERFDRILGDIAGYPAGSAERANGLRAHAIALATAFGIHRGPEALGIDFILDADGCAAYAFERLGPDTPAALALSRRHACVANAIAQRQDQPRLLMGDSASELVNMPGRWCEPTIGPEATLGAALNPLNALDLACETMGLLTPAPPGFRLPLSIFDPNDENAQRGLLEAFGRLPNRTMLHRLLLGAMSAGVVQPRLRGMLVDHQGRFWILDHVNFLSEGPRENFSEVHSAYWDETLKRPLSDSVLVQLPSISDVELRESLQQSCLPTGREQRLLADAAVEYGLVMRPWPDSGMVDRACEAMQTVSDWARQALRATETLVVDDAPGADFREAIANQCSLRVLAASLEADREAAR